MANELKYTTPTNPVALKGLYYIFLDDECAEMFTDFEEIMEYVEFDHCDPFIIFSVDGGIPTDITKYVTEKLAEGYDNTLEDHPPAWCYGVTEEDFEFDLKERL